MIFSKTAPQVAPWHKDVSRNYRRDENALVEELLKKAQLDERATGRIHDHARKLVEVVRKDRRNQGGIDAFMQQYDLSTQEGLVLMCLAEALLRIPDKETADALIEDKLSGTHWEKYLGESDSLFVNASTFGLMITGKILEEEENPQGKAKSIWHNLIKRSGEPVIRQAMRQAMRIMGFQFVLGRSINEALKRAGEGAKKGYRYSFDMLGEAARTKEDAQRYFKAYQSAIAALAHDQKGRGPIEENGISVKLSALHPRYEFSKRRRVLDELAPMVLELAKQAKAANIGFTIDAEEAARLELSLEVIEAVFLDPALNGWDGFGVVVQAYQKRALDVIEMLAGLTRKSGQKMMIRLVKGAYWDSEIKLSQELGLSGYPVFTRKASSDVSFQACAKRLFELDDCFYSQFASHNAYSVATVIELAGDKPFEFQRLHGMGDPLYDQLVGDYPVRVYAPVGSHEDLLSYLVRRLLENGANSSFVNRLVDDSTPIEDIIADPVGYMQGVEPKHHPHIPLPSNLYGPGRENSKGIDLSDGTALLNLQKEMQAFQMPPAVPDASDTDIEIALQTALEAQKDWQKISVTQRADILRKAADLLEDNMVSLMALCVLEAGKNIPDCVAEVREAVDFLRYYASHGEKLFNNTALKARGTFACISPWNFPLAIFIGQVSAALAAGNCVIAKPAEQTPRIGLRAVELLHQAGIPKNALQLLNGTGETVGAKLVNDTRIDGICFTGSNETANLINRSLAMRDGGIIPLIAETGGQNAMIVDSSALLEATVADVVLSAFGSAGQRCSALRVLYIQKDVANDFISLLKGAMAELSIDDPALLSTDVGPVIDMDALKSLQQHVERMKKETTVLAALEAPAQGTFMAPHAFEVSNIKEIGGEVFGPILHVIRYNANDLDNVIEEINSTGFGLTCGVQSRIESRTRYIQNRLKAGNCYINRNMTGAVVGVQPFGGEGLSGTGPKAGGPHYLLRFATMENENSPITFNATATLGIDLNDEKQIQAMGEHAPSLEMPKMINSEKLAEAIIQAQLQQEIWNRTDASQRAAILRRVANRLDREKTTFIAQYHSILKTDLAQAVREVAETIAALRYYANICDAQFSRAEILPGPTGEHNELQLHGRGTLACLCEDDTPLSAFTAQITAALIAGNSVIAIAPQQSLLLCGYLVSLLYEEGIGMETLQLAQDDLRNKLISNDKICAISHVGNGETSKEITKELSQRSGAITPLITEIGNPHYIHRLVLERTLSVNITAAGGNASLLTLDEST